ncbi:NADPH:quinone oxidoreductase family protein [Oceanomicrobium pacificus]|uniref:Zinc-binding dehydrogenase n=1 Tax=Oceanomicrobium pacificus TaxID=2692916 RepID=A0A6B0THH7_9RHOB|nr:NADPH:quinone oxidoreductase family protein [Oceanomicrobium pacificus]MXU63830.1 zinc-binding dehydrogenase [Oceanomicrobium pacificus]
MKAMRIHELGQPLQMDEIDPPQPGPGEVLLDVAACGINFADTLMVQGRYQEKPPLPFSPGLEVCGRVAELGAGVTHLAQGQIVAGFTSGGGLAEQVCVRAGACVPVPAGMDPVEVAAFPVAYGTSDIALELANLSAGETLLVTGASGGVGLTAVEIGKIRGATVIAAARGAEKLAVAKAAGADHLIDTRDADLTAEVKDRGGADVIYDPVGGDLFTAAMKAARPRARLIPIGFASGDVPQIPANILLVKNLSVIGLYWGGLARSHPDMIRDSFARLLGWYGAGKLHPHVSHVLPLDQANDALALLSERRSTGKVVVRMAPD